jgi:hypothetical protein
MNAVWFLALVSIWIALTIVAPDHPREAIRVLDAACKAIGALLVRLVDGATVHATSAVGRAGVELAGARLRLEHGVVAVWEARVRVAKWIWAVAAGIVLLAPYVFSVYLDARAIEWGFEVVFGSAVVDQRPVASHLFSDDPAVAAAATPEAAIARIPLLQPLAMMASRELGQMALGLAVLQGALGLFLFWRAGRDAIGAQLTWSVGGVVRRKMKSGGGSYLSAHDPRDVLGLGTATKLDFLEITWPLPSGRKERFVDVPVDRYVTIVEGRGKIET